MRSSCTLSLYLTYSASFFQSISTFTKAKAMPEIKGQIQGDFLPKFHATPQCALLRYLIYSHNPESHISWQHPLPLFFFFFFFAGSDRSEKWRWSKQSQCLLAQIGLLILFFFFFSEYGHISTLNYKREISGNAPGYFPVIPKYTGAWMLEFCFSTNIFNAHNFRKMLRC